MISLAISRSPERLAFVLFLRTGLRLPKGMLTKADRPFETKFNPYHDADNGQFTFGPGGGSVSDGVYRPGGNRPSLIRTAVEESSRGMGDNGPPLDALTLDQAFPGLSNAPAGAVLAVANPIFDITGPDGQLTSELSLTYSNSLIQQIKAIDPSFHYDSFGFPSTFEGQMRMINDLRWDRAAAIYRATGDAGPLQVETTRYLQDRADAEYDNAQAAAKAGRLPPAPTERMAIGNYIDKAVKKDFRDILGARALSAPSGDAVRVSGREYDSSGDDLTYSIPDARVRDVAFDITIAPRRLSSRQIQRFFNSDFRPNAVVIIRPRQLGSGSTYVITRPRK